MYRLDINDYTKDRMETEAFRHFCDLVAKLTREATQCCDSLDLPPDVRDRADDELRGCLHEEFSGAMRIYNTKHELVFLAAWCRY